MIRFGRKAHRQAKTWALSNATLQLGYSTSQLYPMVMLASVRGKQTKPKW